MSDKITPEQLRKEAVAVEQMHGETLTVDWRTKQANQLRAHADALEENARLKAEKPAPQWLTDNLLQRAERAEAELAKLRQHAEAMAESIDRTVFSTTAQQDALAAYRADFPGNK